MQKVATESYIEPGSSGSGPNVMDRFAPSVLMSTYLVAFVVCDYSNLTASTPQNIRVSQSIQISRSLDHC